MTNNKSTANLEARLNNRPPSSPEEAYLAGLIASDGCRNWRKGRPVALRICLTESDRQVLDDLGAFFQRPVYLVRRKPPKKNECVLTLISQPFDWKICVPELTTGHDVHYMRGLLDGDGYITSRFDPRDRVRRWHLGFKRSVHEEWLGTYVQSYLQARSARFVECLDRKNNVVSIDVWSHFKSVELLEEMYADGICLLRKKSRFEEARRTLPVGRQP